MIVWVAFNSHWMKKLPALVASGLMFTQAGITLFAGDLRVQPFDSGWHFLRGDAPRANRLTVMLAPRHCAAAMGLPLAVMDRRPLCFRW